MSPKLDVNAAIAALHWINVALTRSIGRQIGPSETNSDDFDNVKIDLFITKALDVL